MSAGGGSSRPTQIRDDSALTSEATSARKLIDHLDQAVLAKAFRGELVPQDPNDEPARVLLERIQSARSSTSTKVRYKKFGH
jgi:type I restriction enzyme, S subunit